jgi:transketolase
MPEQLDSKQFARNIRRHALRMVAHANSSHIGSGLSMADIISVLYTSILNVRPQEPSWPQRDRFLLSKGHAAAMLYAALVERGFFPSEWLERYCDFGTPLAGHVTHCKVPGVEVSSGSLGHGLSLACGMALAAKYDQAKWRVFVLLSDGECDEGSVWEAAMFAPFHKLGNLTAIVDYNKIQSFGSVAEVLDLEPFAAKWRAFGWEVIEVDGHDHGTLERALLLTGDGRPRLLLAHTIKGKGVSFMEGQLAWHYKSPNPEQLAAAIDEVEAG